MVKTGTQNAVFILLASGMEVNSIAARIGVSRFAIYRLREKWNAANSADIAEADAARAAATLILDRARLTGLARFIMQNNLGIREGMLLALSREGNEKLNRLLPVV